MTLIFDNASVALPTLMDLVLVAGEKSGSRGGQVSEILHQHIVLKDPRRREILTPGRKASLPAQIAETMWLLAGRDDVEWLANYLPRAVDFSDDGIVWRGAYGKRIRRWESITENDQGQLNRTAVDQLAHVVDLLRKDPTSRRAIIAIYNPSIDSADGKDIPCNDLIQFQARKGVLHAHVFIRSNDLMWGWSGINAFEWSALLEIVAGLLGLGVGELHFSISNLHLYERHWERAKRLADAPALPYVDASPRFNLGHLANVADFDGLVRWWFLLEEKLRDGTLRDYTEIDMFPEPMLRSWLYVIAWWWSNDTGWLGPIDRTALYSAALVSPRVDTVVQAPVIQPINSPAIDMALDHIQDRVDPFIEFVVTLHDEKSKVYGDSWKRRGESGILGNIARKIDRLGVSGAGDTATDTVVDLLVYCVLFRLWLQNPADDQDAKVTGKLRTLSGQHPTDVSDLPRQLAWLVESFAILEKEVQSGNPHQIVDVMIAAAASVGRRLWLDEREGARIDAWQAGNATRSWNPDA